MQEAFIKGKVSVLVVTFNRSNMIHDTIESLLNQTHQNIEILIVDNGSTDDTAIVLDQYKTAEFEDKIKIYHLAENRRWTGGANFVLSKISGEWFTVLDDDDTAHPASFTTMLEVVEQIDPSIDAVTCNVIDSSTGKFAGRGVDKDQYLSFEHLVRYCSGEFWGITRSSLIKNIRFNESLIGLEDTFWYKISAKANRYYIHQGLRVWTTDHGSNMITLQRRKDLTQKAKTYRELASEELYWDSLAKYHPRKFSSKCIKGLLYSKMTNDSETATKYLNKLSQSSSIVSLAGKASMAMPRSLLRTLFSLIPL
ncbi:MAG: glycosyltransferase family 2 protein [Saprospiraceae bacterium]|nr:glycosyltransferase family 2 protein [Saprospiraceae bacterium]